MNIVIRKLALLEQSILEKEKEFAKNNITSPIEAEMKLKIAEILNKAYAI